MYVGRKTAYPGGQEAHLRVAGTGGDGLGRGVAEAERGVGVPGSEGLSTQTTHFQAGQRHLEQVKGRVGAPGCEPMQGWRGHFQAGQRHLEQVFLLIFLLLGLEHVRLHCFGSLVGLVLVGLGQAGEGYMRGQKGGRRRGTEGQMRGQKGGRRRGKEGNGGAKRVVKGGVKGGVHRGQKRVK